MLITTFQFALNVVIKTKAIQNMKNMLNRKENFG